MLLFGEGSFHAFISAHTNIHSIRDPSPPIHTHTHIQLSSSLPCSRPSRHFSFLLSIEHEQHTANCNQEFNRHFSEDQNKTCVHSFIHQVFARHLKCARDSLATGDSVEKKTQESCWQGTYISVGVHKP